MRNIDERLKRVQEQQSAREKDLDNGRIRVDRPERDREKSSSQDRDKASA